MKIILAGAAIMAASLGSVASAAVVTKTFNVTVSDFQPHQGSTPAPFPTVNLSFTITYDEFVWTDPTNSGVVLNSIDIPLSDTNKTLGYFSSGDGLLVVGGSNNGPNTIQGVDDDFYVGFFDADTDNPTFWLLTYENSSVPNIFYKSTHGTVSVVSGAPAPEPASWAMMVGGFSLLGAAMRRRKSAVRFA